MLKLNTYHILFMAMGIPLVILGTVPTLPDISSCSLEQESPDKPGELITVTRIYNRFNQLQEQYFSDSEGKACQGRQEVWPYYLNPVSCPHSSESCTLKHYRMLQTELVQIFSFEQVAINYSEPDSIEFCFTNAVVHDKDSLQPKQVIRKITLTQDRKKGIVTTSFWNDDECKEVCRPLNLKISTVIQALDAAGHLLSEQYRDSTGGIISVQHNQ